MSAPVNRFAPLLTALNATTGLLSRVFKLPPTACPFNVKSKTPATDSIVDLDDILANKVPPPISLKNFEEYLLFTEYAVENLYFILWLREYTKICEIGASSLRRTPEEKADLSNDLTLQCTQSITAFFDPSSSLALNLPSTLISPIQDLVSPQASASSFLVLSHPSPEAFAHVEAYVLNMLNRSLQQFVESRYGKAEKSHTWFSQLIGWAAALTCVALTIVGIFRGWPRATRLAVFPILILACITIFAARDGANRRQLKPFELATPTLTIPELAHDRGHVHTPSSASTVLQHLQPNNAVDIEKGKVEFDSDQTPTSQQSHAPRARTASFIPANAVSDTNPNDQGAAFVFDFDALPPAYYGRGRSPADSRRHPRTPTARHSQLGTITTPEIKASNPILGELMRVLNPKGQWRIYMKSHIYGTLAATALMAILVAVPFPPSAKK
ncbi:hypothetical protein FRB93_008048 [Tulasnella sp. JGI-2019a]|nr:hypothetical protein FRB93_008048 [Tulasnella sp. JGI-2019a]